MQIPTMAKAFIRDFDRELLDGFRRGDRAALGRVFELYASQVARWVEGGFTFSARQGPQRFRGFRLAADTHDVLQEIFRAAFEERARLAYWDGAR